MKKILLSLMMVMTMSLSFAQPTEERVKETIINIVDEVVKNKAVGSTLPGAILEYYTNEAKQTLRVNKVEYSREGGVYIAYISFDVLGIETRAVAYYQKYRGEYYLTFKEFKGETAKKINNWVYINPVLKDMIGRDLFSIL